MLSSFFSFIALLFSLFVVIKSADYAIRYSTRMAEGFRLSRYVIGFLVVAVISALPETFISITSALEGVPSFGLGTLFGSNVADLTLVFALVVLFSGRSLKIESNIIKNRLLYVSMIFLPIVLGLNGSYSSLEGFALVVLGLLFYFYVFKDGSRDVVFSPQSLSPHAMLFLLLSMGGLLLGAHFTVQYGVQLAHDLRISPVLIGLFLVGLGTTLPEFFFSLRAAKNNHDSLALGDILGTVVADATIVVGFMALISPFSFERRIVYVTGIFMILALVLLLYFMKSGRALTRKEAIFLILFYLIFVAAELLTIRGTAA